MDCSLPGSSVHGVSQARTREWVAISFCRGSSPPRDRICISCIAGRFFTTEQPGMTCYLLGLRQFEFSDSAVIYKKDQTLKCNLTIYIPAFTACEVFQIQGSPMLSCTFKAKCSVHSSGLIHPEISCWLDQWEPCYGGLLGASLTPIAL